MESSRLAATKMSVSGEFAREIPTHRAIFRSWKSMKTWVMTWLWFLNAVYWPAFFWLDRIEARYAVVAYLMVLPFIVGLFVRQRGLTRLSGIIHLPFLVLIIWLFPRVFPSTHDGLYGLWLQTLFWATTVCVIFDAVDVVRWFRGERFRLGTPEAVAQRASKAAKSDHL